MKRLGYYTSQFPFPQGRSAGPYAMFLQPPNASLMRVRVACVAVGQQIGQPVKPDLKMQRACGCKRRSHCRCHHRHGLGDDSTLFNPAVQTIYDQNSGIDTGTYSGDYAPVDSSYPGGTSGPAVAAAIASSAGLPAGSSLTYSATWTLGKLLQDWSSVVNTIKLPLASQGIVIDNASGVPWYQSGYGVTLQVHTTSDRNAATDVQAIIDHEIFQCCAGGMPQSSIAVTSLATPNSGSSSSAGASFAASGAASSIGDWVQSNWQLVAIGGVAGVFVLREIL